MAQFLKRAALGRMVTAEGGASDPELLEVRLTADEYKEMCRRICQAEEDKRQAFNEIEERTRLMNCQLNQYKEDIHGKADYKVELAETTKIAAKAREKEAIERAEQVNEELERQKALNENLKRIARERSNAARGITPKKVHDGYLVLNSRQWVEHYNRELTEEEYNAKPDEFKARHKFPCTEHCTANVWKSTIQTPYDASLDLDQIGSLIDKDLWDKGILEDIGGETMNPVESNGVYSDFGGSNGLYKWNFIANYKHGFWEVELYTTRSLRVPEHRRPVICGKKKHS